jgi:hypothetical protein
MTVFKCKQSRQVLICVVLLVSMLGVSLAASELTPTDLKNG